MPPRNTYRRSTPPDLIRRVREDVLNLSRPALASELEVSAPTLKLWERLGAPRWVRFALIGYLATHTTADVANSILWPEH